MSQATTPENVYTDLPDLDVLQPHEVYWRDRFNWLGSLGYTLRSRYDAKHLIVGRAARGMAYASWEDAIAPPTKALMDAKRQSDGKPVILKIVSLASPEYEVLHYLSSPERRSDKGNKCVEVIQVLDDPLDGSKAIFVFPLLCSISMPPVATVRELVDLVRQTLEGLVYLHQHQIVQCSDNMGGIMMDGHRLFPSGFHPWLFNTKPDGRPFSPTSTPPSRTAVRGVKYYFTDFSRSVREPQGGDDVYRSDVYFLGQMYLQSFIQFRSGAEFLRPLTDFMTAKGSKGAPNSSEAVQKFETIVKELHSDALAMPIIHPKPGQAAAAASEHSALVSIRAKVLDIWYRIRPDF